RRDDGYDVTDYYGVDPRYGSPGDFVELMHQAREHGMRVIVDLVINHTSIQHPWFRDARADPKSKYRDWYVWSKKRPRDWNKGMVFAPVQKSTWSYDAAARQYYFHLFYALASGDTRPLVRALERTRQHPMTAQWGHFLRNNDELDLARLTDAQRQLVFDKFAPDKNARIYGRGIRRRLAPMLDGDRRRMELAYSLMFTLPGT